VQLETSYAQLGRDRIAYQTVGEGALVLAGGADHGVGHAQRQADPLAHQLLVGPPGRPGQRLAQQPGTEVGVLDALAWPTPQPGPGKAVVQLLDREARVGIVPVTQPAP
jgi:hypothetical protein